MERLKFLQRCQLQILNQISSCPPLKDSTNTYKHYNTFKITFLQTFSMSFS